MASTTLNTYNASIPTDPLRGFRFTASFAVAKNGSGNALPFDKRILDATDANTPTAGVSTGWVGGFTSVSGLSIATQAIPYREGGFNTTVHQIPGMTTFTPVTFTRGVLFGNDQAMTWMRGLFGAAAGEGLSNATGNANLGNFRVDVTINVNQHPNTTPTNDLPQMQFKVHNAWITALNYTDLDATNGAILFETMQLIHEGLSVSFATTDPATQITKSV
jgi:phage tail-like protein